MSNFVSLLNRMMQVECDYHSLYYNGLEGRQKMFYDTFLKDVPTSSVLIGISHGIMLEDWLFKRIRAFGISAAQAYMHVHQTEEQLIEFIETRHYYRYVSKPPRFFRGEHLETRAIQLYEEKLCEFGYYVKQVRHIQNPKLPWIVASPDGMVMRFGTVSHGVEVKSPHMRSKSGAVILPSWLSRCGNNWSINRLSAVYMQVQMYMAICNLERWDVIVYDEVDDTIIVAQVCINPRFINQVLAKLAPMYFNIMLPILAEKACLDIPNVCL